MKAAILRLAMLALGAAALVALPPQAGAQNQKRVKVQYASKFAVKLPVRKYSPAKTERSEPTIDGFPAFGSSAVLVADFKDGHTLFAKNTSQVTPIASITKLMTAMVVLDAGLPLTETVFIEIADFDFLKSTHSRLGMGTGLPRGEMLRLALMSSENRAAASLARAYPGGSAAFIGAMNRKAVELGMSDTHFVDSTGLSRKNVSTAQDLVKLVKGAYEYPLIREFTTTTAHQVENLAGHNLQFGNTNGLVKNPAWQIGLSKTGYISEAGRCLVMQAMIAARPVIIVLLDSAGKATRMADANRIKKWLESSTLTRMPGSGSAAS